MLQVLLQINHKLRMCIAISIWEMNRNDNNDRSTNRVNTIETDEKRKAQNLEIVTSAERKQNRGLLPPDFQPLPYSVQMGRQRVHRNSTGNQRLRVLAASMLEKYAAAENDKNAKSELVASLMSTIRSACPVGAFVTFVDGRWWEVDDQTAR